MAKKNFIKQAIKRPGALKRAAERKGESVSQIMEEKHTGRLGHEIAFAKTLEKIRDKK